MEKSVFFDISLVAYLLSAFLYMLWVLKKKRMLQYVCTSTLTMGMISHTVFIIQRWTMAGYPPFSNTFETLVFFSWALVVQYLFVEFFFKYRFLGSAASFLALFILAYSSFFPSAVKPLMPALQNNFWLTIHVILCFIGYSAFALSFLASVFHLISQKDWHQKAALFLLCAIIVGIVAGTFASYLYKTGKLAIYTNKMHNGKLRVDIHLGKAYLFSANADFRKLNDGRVPENLRAKFAGKKHEISNNTNIEVKKKNVKWLLADKSHNKEYAITKAKSTIIFSQTKRKKFAVVLGVSAGLKFTFAALMMISILWFPVFLLISKMKWNTQEAVLEKFVYGAIAFGFPFLGMGIFSGSVWANEAWGSYWGWDPKETCSLITWLIYAVALHIKYMKGWKGARMSWLSVIGFISVLFTYFGVNYLLPGLHSYA